MASSPSAADAPPLRIGDRLWLVPGHCDPTVNLYDWIVGVRGTRVECVWPVAARGALGLTFSGAGGPCRGNRNTTAERSTTDVRIRKGPARRGSGRRRDAEGARPRRRADAGRSDVRGRGRRAAALASARAADLRALGRVRIHDRRRDAGRPRGRHDVQEVGRAARLPLPEAAACCSTRSRRNAPTTCRSSTPRRDSSLRA